MTLRSSVLLTLSITVSFQLIATSCQTRGERNSASKSADSARGGRTILPQDITIFLPFGDTDVTAQWRSFFSGRQGQYWKEEVGKFDETFVSEETQMRQALISGVRIEHCFECIGTEISERYSVRLVVQWAIRDDDDQVIGYSDGAAHFVYLVRDQNSIDYENFSNEILDFLDVTATVRATNGITNFDRSSAYPHDLLSQPTDAQAQYKAALHRLVNRTLTISRLDHVTVSKSGRSQDNWTMETLRKDQDNIFRLVREGAGSTEHFSLTSQSLANIELDGIGQALADQNDPSMRDTSNTSCTDCHKAMHVAKNIRVVASEEGYRRASQPYPSLRVLTDLEPSPTLDRPSFLIHGFAYKGRVASISAYVLRAGELDVVRFMEDLTRSSH